MITIIELQPFLDKHKDHLTMVDTHRDHMEIISLLCKKCNDYIQIIPQNALIEKIQQEDHN